MDMEAGIGHLGRGTGSSCEAALMVVDPSYESLKLSEKILCKLPLSEELVNAGLSGDTLERRFEEIQKLIAALG